MTRRIPPIALGILGGLATIAAVWHQDDIRARAWLTVKATRTRAWIDDRRTA